MFATANHHAGLPHYMLPFLQQALQPFWLYYSAFYSLCNKVSTPTYYLSIHTVLKSMMRPVFQQTNLDQQRVLPHPVVLLLR